jgi:plasmid stabilization system protein ParE
MRRLSYTLLARTDLENIDRYLRKEADARTAADQLDLIRRTANRLIDFPRSGPAIETGPFRTIRVRGTPFLLVYRLSGDDVEIMRVFHGARDWPNELA